MRSKKPIIGITQSATVLSKKYRWPSRYAFDHLKREYCRSVIDAGGIPVPLSNTTHLPTVRDYIKIIDGLLVSGGDDMHPEYFGQKPHPSITLTAPNRDAFEIEIIKRALKKNIPILGICRGAQVINIATGGTIYQDLSCAPFETLPHADPKEVGDRYHQVRVEKESLLYAILGRERIEVNSSHHQIIDKTGKKLRVSAYSRDGVIEGLESPDYRFLLPVQWHPEMTPKRFHSKRLFKAFVKACTKK